MSQYLYGASVQGIQSFLFQTNKLKEIVGASQIVDNICTSKFKKFCKSFKHDLIEDNLILSAAGNIKYLVEDRATCEQIVLSFPKMVSNYAPGITISQAVVKCSQNLKEDIDKLERQLKAQRNIPSMPIDTGFMGLERARRTGGVAVEKRKIEYIDRATLEKIDTPEVDTLRLFRKFSGIDVHVRDVPFNLNKITENEENAWIAIVHADGNGLGLLLSNMSKELGDDKDKVRASFSKFSKELEIATQEAAQIAFHKVIGEEELAAIQNKKGLLFPMRPVVLGGDDLTLIIRADLAFDFATSYLKAFEERTKERFKKLGITSLDKGLTACAGISYIKTAYPFHYGVHLAEELTGAAKKYSKEINPIEAPSSIYFYKVQASFIENLSSMMDRTRFAEASKVNFDRGPYLLKNNGTEKAHIEELLDPLSFLLDEDNEDNGISKVRNWVAELHKDSQKSAFLLNRIEQFNKVMYDKLELNVIHEALKNTSRTDSITSNINDLIVLSSFKKNKHEIELSDQDVV